MPLADFTVDVEYEGTPRQVRVVVYETLKGLRSAASRHDNATRSKRRRVRNGFADTLGICHRFEYQDHEGASHPYCALVRLAEPHLGVGIVSHELAHAAVWIRELAEDDRPLTTADDEPFVWMLGELVRQTINAMHAHGVYDD